MRSFWSRACILLLIVVPLAQVESLQSSKTSGTLPPSTITTRRAAIMSSILGAGGSLLFPSSVHARVTVEETILLKGTVTLAPGVVQAASESGGALYLTCRPDNPDNAPAAILNGSRGKSPPVLAARIETPAFPLEWELSSPRDLTPEGAAGAFNQEVVEVDQLWWKNEDLIVSARWDSDGVAATRSPDDLVGRGIWKQSSDEKVEVQLTDRGAFGKYVTGSKK